MSGRKRSLSGPACSAPAKRKKCACSYQKCWESNFKWVKPSDRSPHDAYCTLCNSHLSIGAGARNDLVRHAKTITHSTLEKSQAESKGMTSFLTKSKSVLTEKITNAETLFYILWLNTMLHFLLLTTTQNYANLCFLIQKLQQ